MNGVLVDIDGIVKVESDDFWNRLDERLEHTHSLSTRMSFNLVTPETLSRLERVYEPERGTSA